LFAISIGKRERKVIITSFCGGVKRGAETGVETGGGRATTHEKNKATTRKKPHSLISNANVLS
jgi:hypothetical protein